MNHSLHARSMDGDEVRHPDLHVIRRLQHARQQCRDLRTPRPFTRPVAHIDECGLVRSQRLTRPVVAQVRRDEHVGSRARRCGQEGIARATAHGHSAHPPLRITGHSHPTWTSRQGMRHGRDELAQGGAHRQFADSTDAGRNR